MNLSPHPRVDKVWEEEYRSKSLGGEEPVRISPAGCIMKKSLISNINLQDIVYGLNMSIL